MHPLTESNTLLNQPDTMRARAWEDGYLFFRSLLDPKPILEVRQKITSICAKAGWLAPNTDPMEGIAQPDITWVSPHPEFMKVYNVILKVEEFHALAHEKPLITLFNTLFGEPTLVHARHIARIIFPQNVKYTTPAHQDYYHIRGTENCWTAWIPLGDCPQELGGIALLRSSHCEGLQSVQPAYGAGGVGIDTTSMPHEELSTDYRIGDVLVFHSLTIHRGLPNLTADRVRFSVDYRYQPLSQPVTASSFLPHHGQITWEEVYADWKSERYKYYWRDLPVRFVAPDK
jgi:ectoine hydroxylase-related dioxygenase (phytanoyl-CoA dioxygenase family)